MDQVKTIIKVYLATKSVKATARRLQVSKNTVKSYLNRARASGKKLEQVLTLSDDECEKIMYDRRITREREQYFEDKVRVWINDLGKVGVTRQLL